MPQTFDEQTRALLQPFALGDIHLRNRVVLAPMTRARAGAERMANALMAEYYAQRAGAGLLISEATTVSAQGNGWVESPGVYTDAQGLAWKPVVEAVHAKGAPMFLQLWHCGRASHSDFHGGELPVAPSAIKNGGEYIHTPLGKKDYEVPRTNHRDDAYGGSVENRFRLLREVVEGVSTVFDAGRIGVRLAPNGVFNDMGSPDYRESFTYVAGQLDSYGLAYLHVMDGLAFGFHKLGEPMTLEDFRAVFSGPLMGNCGYTRETAEAAVARGAADLIAIGRPFITNPDLVERFRNGWPLAPDSDPGTWYSGGIAEEGYSTFPSYDPGT